MTSENERFRDGRRLPASLMVLLTLGIGGLLVDSSPSAFCGFISLLGGVFIYTWHSLYGRLLSRQIRAVFDEANVLRSYRIRDRTIGHLFEPELPTPVPIDSKKNIEEENNNFVRMRNAHYAGEYQKVTRMNKEAEGIQPGKTFSSATSPEQQFIGDDLEDNIEGGEI